MPLPILVFLARDVFEGLSDCRLRRPSLVYFLSMHVTKALRAALITDEAPRSTLENLSYLAVISSRPLLWDLAPSLSRLCTLLIAVTCPLFLHLCQMP